MPLTGRLMNSEQKVVKRPAAVMKRPAKQKRPGLRLVKTAMKLANDSKQDLRRCAHRRELPEWKTPETVEMMMTSPQTNCNV